MFMVKEVVSANVGFKRWFFFFAGIVATIAYRIIIVLDAYWTKVMWYVGTVGFILYFGHRAHIQKKRAEIVRKNGLIGVVDSLKKVNREQKDALKYLVRSAVTSKANWNSLFILWLSVLALFVGVVFDFIL